MDPSVIQSVETASTRAAVIVGGNVHITSGKETDIINAPWNVCEVKEGTSPWVYAFWARNKSTKSLKRY